MACLPGESACVCQACVPGGFAHEPIAGAADGKQVFWAGRIVFDHAAQPHNKVVDGATGDIGGIFPDFGLQPGSRQDNPVIFKEVSEQFLENDGW